MLTHEELEYLRDTSQVSLVQWYTLQHSTLSAADAYGEKQSVPGAASIPYPCWFEAEGKRVMTDLGPVIRTEPVLYVLPADTLAPGDIVSNIVNEVQEPVDGGTFEVREVHPVGGLMNAQRRAKLERVTRGHS